MSDPSPSPATLLAAALEISDDADSRPLRQNLCWTLVGFGKGTAPAGSGWGTVFRLH